jgi:tetratricopeptide (TPR) repeat protein
MIRVIFLCLLIFLSSGVYAEVPQEILNKINSENVDDRLDACLMLGRLGSQDAIPLLQDKLRDGSMLVRHSAANALARIGGPEVNAIFKGMVASESIEKKRIGLAGLAMTGDPGSIEIVMKELDNSDWQVRWSAVYALGEWGYRPALSKLNEIAQNDPHKDSATGEYTIRKRAEEVCKKILCSIEWYRNLRDAQFLAEKLQKPVWAYWYIEDNDLCKKMDETFFSTEVSDISQSFICVRIDGAKDSESVLKYDVGAVPCIILLDKEDNEIDRIMGVVSRENLISRMKKVVEGKGTPKQWKENIAKNQNDIESAWHLAEFYLDNARIQDAIPLLENVVKYDVQNQSGYVDNALFALGYSLGAIGKYANAVGVLEDLKTRYPSFKDMDKALYCLGLDYLSINKPKKAKEIFTELVDVYSESSVVKPAKEILGKL